MAVLELLIIFVLSFLVYKYVSYLYNCRGLPPYPKDGYLPVFGHFLAFLKLATTPDGVPNEIINGLKNGPIYTSWIPGFPIITVQDFDLIKEMTRRDDFAARPVNAFNEYLPLAKNSTGIVNSNGEVWRHNRRFSLTWLRNFGFGKNLMEKRINSQIDKMMDWLNEDVEKAAAEGKPAIIDFELPLKFTISSIIAQMALGISYDRGDPQYKKLERYLDDVFKLFSDPVILPHMFFPFLKSIPLFGHLGFDKIPASGKPLEAYFFSEVKRIRKEFTAGSEPSNIVEAYLEDLREEQAKGSKSQFGDEQIAGVIADLWAAGQETTANSTLWALLYMVNYPDIQEKVFQQIKDVCGLERRPELSDQRELTYVAAVISEVQRLSNILPNAVAHTAVKDTTLGGYRIPENVLLQYSIMALHFDPKYFPEPQKFKPERHLEEDGKTLRKIDELIPFGMGKRVCLGESMARQELFLIFTAVIQRFKLGVVPGEDMPTLRYRMKGTVSTHPYRAAVTSRS